MSIRRNNYTGNENEQIIKNTAENADGENKRPPKNPMMVLHEVARRWHHLVEDGAPTQFMQNSSRAILRVLSQKTGICQLDLSKATHLKPPTISVALQKMEAEGLVTRIIDDVDMRATRVYLTEKGNALNDQIRDRLVNADMIALSGLTEEEQKTLMGILERLNENLAAAQKE